MKLDMLHRIAWCLIRASAAGLLILTAFGPLNPALGTPRTTGPQENSIDKILKRYQQFEMEPIEAARNVKVTGELTLSAENSIFHIKMAPFDVRAPQYRAEEVISGGFTRAVQPEAIRTFRGTVTGMPGSEVRFSIREDSLEGIILTPDEWYLVEPMRNYDPASKPETMIIYRASDIVPNSYGTCDTSLAERIEKAQDYLIPKVLKAGGSIAVADVATEADYEYVTAFGSSASANNTILDVMNQVDGIYRSQLSISLQVIYQHTWAVEADPYISTAPSTMLGEFRTYWMTYLNSQPFDLAHMWTGKDMDGSTIGIAYVGVVCNARSYSFGASQRFSPSPGKYILTAHEIGHNFGASHPDQADPPHAECANTIMNSSVGTGTNFCAFSQDEISAHTLGNSSCLATVSHSCDVNNDGQLSVLDLQSLANVILGFSACPGSCDTNRDESVNALDIQLLLDIILGVASCPQ